MIARMRITGMGVGMIRAADFIVEHQDFGQLRDASVLVIPHGFAERVGSEHADEARFCVACGDPWNREGMA